MQLIQHQEFQALRVPDHSLVKTVLARHEQFEHHEIGEQYVGLSLGNLPPFCVVFLAGISCDGRTKILVNSRVIDVFFDLSQLTVSESIHWIDYDGASATWLTGTSRPHNCVNNWHKKAEGFTRASSGRDDKTLLIPRLCNCALLMPVECERRSFLAKSKYLAESWINYAIIGQLIY